MTDAEAHSLLAADAANCPLVRAVAARAEDDEPVLSGGWYKYTVAVDKDRVRVKPKIDVTKSMVLMFVCLPFALWFVWGVQTTGDDFFRQAALPLASMFISFGLIYTIAYLIGGKEQQVILPFIYNTLNKDSDKIASGTGKTGMFGSYFSAITCLIIGIVILILHFVM